MSIVDLHRRLPCETAVDMCRRRNVKSSPLTDSELSMTRAILAVFDIAPGQFRLFDTSATHAWCTVNSRYWFEFGNPFIGKPWSSAAVVSGEICYPSGPYVIHQSGMSEGDTLEPVLDGHQFYIHRNRDRSDFKYFSLTMAATL